MDIEQYIFDGWLYKNGWVAAHRAMSEALARAAQGASTDDVIAPLKDALNACRNIPAPAPLPNPTRS